MVFLFVFIKLLRLIFGRNHIHGIHQRIICNTAHLFDNVEDSYDEFDDQAKIKGLHEVRRKVESIPRRPILPDDLWNQYAQSTFWKYK